MVRVRRAAKKGECAVGTTGDVGPVVVSPVHVSSGGRLSLPNTHRIVVSLKVGGRLAC